MVRMTHQRGNRFDDLTARLLDLTGRVSDRCKRPPGPGSDGGLDLAVGTLALTRSASRQLEKS
jgi:hypothetical protein